MCKQNIELLSPAGSFDSLVSAVQNGASAVYLGLRGFNARSSANNFDLDSLKDAIFYAKIRGAKVYLTLNILINNTEIPKVIDLVSNAYRFGIDAIIVEDIGIIKLLSETFPDLHIHVSTQATVYNLDGIKQLEKLGVKRVVLARELSLEEIKYICSNTSVEIEVFVHGALCISYSGTCLMSSIIGGRSGNRGKCAQSCRLPYTFLNDEIRNTENVVPYRLFVES